MASTAAVGVGLIGAGTISDEYLGNLTRFPDVRVLAVGDLATDRAASQSEKYGVAASGTPDTVIDHPEIEIVVNLTIPAAHHPVSLAALQSGKSVWTEKPLALTRAQGRELIATAAEHGQRIGAATDTFLGPALQTVQRMIAEGAIGTPLSAVTLMQDPGPEGWHPSPEFIYARGAGPVWDRGPYYLSMLTQIFGSMTRVGAAATTAFARRHIHRGPAEGRQFDVDVPTNVAVITQFESGAVAQSTYSYESSVLRGSWVEVNGTEGTIAVPDPNFFDGVIRVYPKRFPSLEEQMATRGAAPAVDEWQAVDSGPAPATRGIGLLDMARSIRADVPHRASAEYGYHLLDALSAIDDALASGEFRDIESRSTRLEPLPADWDPFARTL